MTLEEKLQNLPAQPGCYLHKNAKSEIIYISKAESVRNSIARRA
jgi:excinuclease ABC subunit C